MSLILPANIGLGFPRKHSFLNFCRSLSDEVKKFNEWTPHRSSIKNNLVIILFIYLFLFFAQSGKQTREDILVIFIYFFSLNCWPTAHPQFLVSSVANRIKLFWPKIYELRCFLAVGNTRAKNIDLRKSFLYKQRVFLCNWVFHWVTDKKSSSILIYWNTGHGIYTQREMVN
jgi:hypothetical protein